MTVATIHNTFGLLFDAAIFSSMLFGVACLQGWLYFRKYWRRDHWYITGLVAALLICDSCQVAILAASLYKYLVTNQANSSYLTVLIPTFIVQHQFTALITLLVQIFYCYRIWKISRRMLMALPAAALSLTSFVFVTIYCAKGIRYGTVAQLRSLSTVSTAALGLTAATSSVVSITMAIVRYRSKHGFKQNTDILARIIYGVFDAGIPMSIFSLASVILLKAEHLTFLFIFFYILVGHFNSVAIFVMLNSRGRMRGGGNGGSSEHSSSGQQSGFQLTPTSRGTRGGVTIRIDTATQHDVESAASHDAKNNDQYDYETEASSSKIGAAV